MRRGRRPALRSAARDLRAAVVLAGLAGLSFSPGAEAARPLTLGFDAYPPLGSPTAQGAQWSARAVGDGAQLIRIVMPWSAVAPAARPAGFRPEDPASPGYRWSAIDAEVRAIAGSSARIVLSIYSAPAWAEGPGRPASAAAGSWRPSADQFGRFARAAATRYSGSYRDAGGWKLPRIGDWEAWNEPNLSNYLEPQWTSLGHGRFAATSPGIYRALLDAFYDAVKGVSSRNVVVAGATAPFGDLYPGALRIPPVTFVRDFLCLRAGTLRPAGCSDPARFDVLDHHPYDISGPTTPAVNAGDVSIPDMGKLTRMLRAALRARTVLPQAAKQVWATEIAWASRPPDPGGVPVSTQARWLEQALFVLWRQGVSTVLWLQPRDDPPQPSTGLDAGIYFFSGTAKPAALAFRFPFLTTRTGAPPGSVLAWGRAPATGSLSIEEQSGRRWIRVAALRVRKLGVFETALRLFGPAMLRARVGGVTSLAWTQAA